MGIHTLSSELTGSAHPSARNKQAIVFPTSYGAPGLKPVQLDTVHTQLRGCLHDTNTHLAGGTTGRQERGSCDASDDASG